MLSEQVGIKVINFSYLYVWESIQQIHQQRDPSLSTPFLRHMMTTATVELQSLPSDASRNIERQQQILDNSNESQPTVIEFSSLPPVDTGKQAWLFLAACWGVEAVTFGTKTFPP